MRRTALILLAGCLALRGAEKPKKHIRVILDTSQSLRGTDPSGYVKLATALLYDLSWQTLDEQDTFKIVRFKQNWPKMTTPPPDTGPVLEPERGRNDRDKFIQNILALTYDDDWTYFVPGFRWSYEDLKNYPAADNKVIVLVTDGVPDDQVRDAEGRIFASELTPKLREAGIKVYILALGEDVERHAAWFADAFQFNTVNGVAGDMKPGRNVDHLLRDMLDIFSRSFGYSCQWFSSIPSRIAVDDGRSIRRAAVVALYDQPREPGFTLKSPAGGRGATPVNTAVGIADPHARTPGRPASYAYQWLVPPDKGDYEFQSKQPPPTEVAVLRPVDIDIKVRSYRGVPTNVMMAGKPSPMEVLIEPSQGATGDPGSQLRVNYYLHYCTPGATRNASKYASAKPIGDLTPEGRLFLIYPQFEDRKCEVPGSDPNSFPGYIEIEVSQYDTVIARLFRNPHAVQVYPNLAIRPIPSPAILTASGREFLRAGETGCVTVKFQAASGNLSSSRYTLGVRLDPPLESAGPFRGASVSFDGSALEPVAPGSRDWQLTRAQRPGDLIGDHKICMSLGSPTEGVEKRELTASFGVWQNRGDPYEQLKVIEDLTLRVSVSAPDFWQTWGAWLAMLGSLALLSLLAVLWKARLRQAPDLCVAVARGGSPWNVRPLPQNSLRARWFGLPADQPVISLSGDRRIGSLRPLGAELYAFVPARGLGNVSVEDNGEWRLVQPSADGTVPLAAGKRYRAGMGADEQYFQVAYAAQRPEV